MVPDHFVDDEAQEFLGEIGVKVGLCCQHPQPRDLSGFAVGIGGGQAVLGLVGPDRLRHLEPFGEHEHQRGVDIVDALAVLVQPIVSHARISPYSLALAAHAVQRNCR